MSFRSFHPLFQFAHAKDGRFADARALFLKESKRRSDLARSGPEAGTSAGASYYPILSPVRPPDIQPYRVSLHHVIRKKNTMPTDRISIIPQLLGDTHCCSMYFDPGNKPQIKKEFMTYSFKNPTSDAIKKDIVIAVGSNARVGIRSFLSVMHSLNLLMDEGVKINHSFAALLRAFTPSDWDNYFALKEKPTVFFANIISEEFPDLLSLNTKVKDIRYADPKRYVTLGVADYVEKKRHDATARLTRLIEQVPTPDFFEDQILMFLQLRQFWHLQCKPKNMGANEAFLHAFTTEPSDTFYQCKKMAKELLACPNDIEISTELDVIAEKIAQATAVYKSLGLDNSVITRLKKDLDTKLSLVDKYLQTLQINVYTGSAIRIPRPQADGKCYINSHVNDYPVRSKAWE